MKIWRVSAHTKANGRTDLRRRMPRVVSFTGTSLSNIVAWANALYHMGWQGRYLCGGADALLSENEQRAVNTFKSGPLALGCLMHAMDELHRNNQTVILTQPDFLYECGSPYVVNIDGMMIGEVHVHIVPDGTFSGDVPTMNERMKPLNGATHYTLTESEVIDCLPVRKGLMVWLKRQQEAQGTLPED